MDYFIKVRWADELWPGQMLSCIIADYLVYLQLFLFVLSKDRVGDRQLFHTLHLHFVKIHYSKCKNGHLWAMRIRPKTNSNKLDRIFLIIITMELHHVWNCVEVHSNLWSHDSDQDRRIFASDFTPLKRCLALALRYPSWTFILWVIGYGLFIDDPFAEATSLLSPKLPSWSVTQKVFFYLWYGNMSFFSNSSSDIVVIYYELVHLLSSF